MAEALNVPDVFQIEWEDTIPHLIIDRTMAKNSHNGAAKPGSPPTSIPLVGGGGALESLPHNPNHDHGGSKIQWATPPTRQSVDSEGAPLRYTTIPNLLETT